MKHMRWKTKSSSLATGALAGLIGGLVGTAAMNGYWKLLEKTLGHDPRQLRTRTPGPLDDISLVGDPTREGEASTDTVGRLVYEALTGRQRTAATTKKALGTAVHWTYGALQGALYGTARRRHRGIDPVGGPAFGTGLWGFSELVLPALGLGKGPTAYPPENHAATWGAHAVYGLTTSAVAGLLRAWRPTGRPTLRARMARWMRL